MLEEFEYKGKWWIPENPDAKIDGILKYLPTKGANLVLYPEKNLKSCLPKIDIILGDSYGKKLTLYNCLGSEFHFTGKFALSSVKYYSKMVFDGIHFHKIDDIKFKEISLDYLYLDKWVNINSFEYEDDHNNEQFSFILKYKFPKPLILFHSDKFEVSIGFRINRLPVISRLPTKIEVEQTPTLTIKFEQEKAHNECLELIRFLQNFFSFALSKTVNIISIKGNSEKKTMNVFENKAYIPIGIYYRQNDFPEKETISDTCNMVFAYSDITHKADIIFENLFNKAAKLNLPLNIYCGVVHYHDMYLEHMFLNIFQAIESYHWRFFNGKFDKVIDRFVHLVSIHSSLLNNYFNVNNFRLDKIISTRHYLAHYIPKLEKEALKDVELFNAFYKLKLLFEICILTEFGFTDIEINKFFDRNFEYHNFRTMYDRDNV
jgi:hypothetical protein